MYIYTYIHIICTYVIYDIHIDVFIYTCLHVYLYIYIYLSDAAAAQEPKRDSTIGC
jgi:hypothetical protein